MHWQKSGPRWMRACMPPRSHLRSIFVFWSGWHPSLVVWVCLTPFLLHSCPPGQVHGSLCCTQLVMLYHRIVYIFYLVAVDIILTLLSVPESPSCFTDVYIVKLFVWFKIHIDFFILILSFGYTSIDHMVGLTSCSYAEFPEDSVDSFRHAFNVRPND